MTSYRNYCFTSYEKDDPKMDKDVQYCIWQWETCPTTGKEHRQGYIEMKDKCSLKKIKNILGNSVHVSPRKGTQEQAIRYCMKYDTAIEDRERFIFGKPKNQGNRSDLDSIVEAMENGKSTSEILREFGGNALRHISMIEKGLECLWGVNKMDTHIRNYRKEIKKLSDIQFKNVKDEDKEDLLNEMMKPPY